MSISSTFTLHLDLLTVIKTSQEAKTYLAQDTQNSLFVVKIYKSFLELKGAVSEEYLSSIFSKEGHSIPALKYLSNSEKLNSLTPIIKPLKIFQKAFHGEMTKTYLMLPYLNGKTLDRFEDVPSISYALKLSYELFSVLIKALDEGLIYDGLDLDKLFVTPSYDLKLFGLDHFKTFDQLKCTHGEYLKDFFSVLDRLFAKVSKDQDIGTKIMLILQAVMTSRPKETMNSKFCSKTTPSFLKEIFELMMKELC